MSKPSDIQLIKSMQAGDTAAFDVLYDRYWNMVKTRISRIVYDVAAQEDLLQNVFLKLWTHSSQWTGKGELGAWLQKIATNTALNHLRSKKRHPAQSLESKELTNPIADTELISPDEAMHLIELRQALETTIASLPEQQREVIKYVYEKELNLQETADAMDIPVGTVKSRLYHAKSKLKDALKEWKDV